MKDSLKNVSTRWIKSLWFALARKSKWGNRIKHLLENTFPLYGKTASSDKKLKMVSTSKKIFLLKLIPPNFNHGFQQQKKRLQTKSYCFHETENKFPLAREWWIKIPRLKTPPVLIHQWISTLPVLIIWWNKTLSMN